MKVVAFVPYQPGFSSGQRLRIELWRERLRERGIEIELCSFSDHSLTSVLYQRGKTASKAYRLAIAYCKQVVRAITMGDPDLIFIYREASLIGPAVMERFLRRRGIPIIYDLDEPLFVPYISPKSGRFSTLKFPRKVNRLFALSDLTFTVNHAIGSYASEFVPDVRVVPMAVDTDAYFGADVGLREGMVRVAWTGTFTTQRNLHQIADPLARLQSEGTSELVIIADDPTNLPALPAVTFVQWQKEIEASLLKECQVGVVPVEEDAWSPWKFFFKTVLFMSMGLPIVASRVGSNAEIIRDGENGFLATGQDEWYAKLKLLVDDPQLRIRMGREARRTAQADFSLTKQIDFVEQCFRELACRT